LSLTATRQQVYTASRIVYQSREAIGMCNVGGIDRVLRILVGLALISLVFVGPKIIWGWVGLVPLLTGIFKFCPAYKLLGLNTCPTK
jgi:hypothetical protein